MAKRDKDKFHDRTWLNPEEGRASIEVTATLNRAASPHDSTNVFAEVEISDCNRTVTLDFGMYDPSDVPEKLAKLARLITRLKLLETALKQYGPLVRSSS